MEITDQTIICAGIPRCGTTMMYRALAGLPRGATTPKGGPSDIIKTHSYRPQRFAGAAKAIFLFGDPVAAVISTKTSRYTPAHFRNCGARNRDPETTDIFSEDALNYERMFDAWTRRTAVETICVRYETLYQNLRLISAFFADRPVYFPPPQQRTTNVEQHASPEEVKRIRQTYADLIRKVDRAPDVALFGSD